MFPRLPSSAHPTLQLPVNSHTVVHVRGSFIHVLCLVPSPSFHHYPPTPSPLVTVSLFHISMPVFLFCSLVHFAHEIHHIGKIMWYLSFTTWLASLTIIFSINVGTLLIKLYPLSIHINTINIFIMRNFALWIIIKITNCNNYLNSWHYDHEE